ncbi:MAG: hypothetical protein AB7S26_28065 [Sandaracinaceae bacterium]
MALDPGELLSHGAILDRLEAELEAAHAASALPEAPTTVDALDDLVVRMRLSA